MKIVVVVDANIILSALLGGKPSSILFDPKFNFVTTSFTIKEVEKYLPRVEKKIGADREKIEELLNKLPLTVYSKDFYKDYLKEAKKQMGDIDPDDVKILALAIKLETYVWSQDKDFEEVDYTKVLKTYDFINED